MTDGSEVKGRGDEAARNPVAVGLATQLARQRAALAQVDHVSERIKSSNALTYSLASAAIPTTAVGALTKNVENLNLAGRVSDITRWQKGLLRQTDALQSLLNGHLWTQGLSKTITSKLVVPKGVGIGEYTSAFQALKLDLPKVGMDVYFPNLWSLAIPKLLDDGLWRPSNWPRDFDYDKANEILNEDGIPLVYVPRESIVAELLAADDRAARIGVLEMHRAELIEDCRRALDYFKGAASVGLASKALDALAEGHDAAAQALAVIITDAQIKTLLDIPYPKIREKVQRDIREVTIGEIRLLATFAAAGLFYVEWSPKSPSPPPESLSRHATVHHAAPAQFTTPNALVSVMLMVSILRAIDEFDEDEAAA